MRDWWVKFKVSDSQNFWQGKGVCYQFYSGFYGLQEQINVTEVKTLIWMCKSWLKALKTRMPKVSATGYARSCRRLQRSWVDDISFGRFTILSAGKMFLVEKNGVGALNPLAVNDKRYYWKGLFGPCIFVTRATLFEGIKFCCLLEMSFTANSFIDVTWFSEKQWTFAYCIQISKDLDTIAESLKIFIQFFIGHPITCTWCGIHAVIV